jgi:hypothetical protein
MSPSRSTLRHSGKGNSAAVNAALAAARDAVAVAMATFTAGTLTVAGLAHGCRYLCAGWRKGRRLDRTCVPGASPGSGLLLGDVSMNEPSRSLLVFVGVLVLILYLPMPFPLQLCGLIGATLWINGLRRGGRILLIASPLLVSGFILAYFPASQRTVGTFIIAYMLGLFIVGVVGYGKLTVSVWRFLMETRAQLRDAISGAVPSELVSESDSPTQKRPWAERLARRILGVS